MYAGKRRKLNRKTGHDYSQNGYYFVTICVKNRTECLGEIKNEEMAYNRYGQTVLKCWQAIPDHYPNVFLDEWIIMPNHIHGIIIIENNESTNSKTVGTEQCSVPTDAVKQKNYGQLSKIIKSFKEKTTKTIHNDFNDPGFAWQRSFYDHIIWNEKSLAKIRKYIYYNPAKWETDRNNPENLLM